MWLLINSKVQIQAKKSFFIHFESKIVNKQWKSGKIKQQIPNFMLHLLLSFLTLTKTYFSLAILQLCGLLNWARLKHFLVRLVQHQSLRNEQIYKHFGLELLVSNINLEPTTKLTWSSHCSRLIKVSFLFIVALKSLFHFINWSL